VKVFADAFFYIALINRLDAAHERAKQWAAEFDGEVVTTQWILTEVADAFSGSAIRHRVKPALDKIAEDPDATVVPVSPEYFERGLELYHARPDKTWSLTDCISFVVMADEGLTETLTRDHHFEQAGFTALFAD
jgi:predicted nucleic acid-binding protein